MRTLPFAVWLMSLVAPACAGTPDPPPYLPADSLVQVVATTEEPVEFLLFAAPGDTADVLVRPYLERLAEEEGAALQVVDQVLEPELAREFQVRGNGFLVVRQGDRHERIRLGDDAARACREVPALDGHLQRALDSLATTACSATLVAGEGRDLSMLAQLLGNMGYPADSLGAGEAWPADTCLAVAAAPLGEAQDAALAEHVAAGGHLLLLTAGDGGATSTLAALGVGRGEHTLAHDRIFVQATFTDEDRAYLVTRQMAPHPAVATVARNATRTAVIAPFSVALEAGPRGTALMRGEAGTFVDRDGDRELDAGEEGDPPVLGVAVEGEAGGRACVYGSASLFDDRILGGNQGNAFLAADTVTWLAGTPAPVETTTDVSTEQEERCVDLAPAAVEGSPILTGSGPVTALRWDGGSLARAADERGEYVRLQIGGRDRVGSERAAAVLDGLASREGARRVQPADERLAALGLEPPLSSVTVERDGAEQTVDLGEVTYGGGDRLVRVGDTVLVAPGRPVKDLEFADTRLADRQLTPLAREGAVSIAVHLPDGSTRTLTDPSSGAFVKLQRLWALDDPVTAPPEDAAVFSYEVHGADASWPVVLHRDPAQDHWTAHSAWQRGYVGVSTARVDEIWFALGLAGSPP